MNQSFANETQIDKFRMNKLSELSKKESITEVAAHRCSVAIL